MARPERGLQQKVASARTVAKRGVNVPESVFLSSTCYDLLDLRAEIDRHLTAAGMRVVRSDALDFQVEPDKNSIETCLCRVRDTDHFVCVLSERYGPSLLKAGYDDVSATELEYRAARESKKDILFFVRDRLLADHSLWKKAGRKDDFVPAFAEPKDALRLFRFIDAHAELAKDSEISNWVSTFATVVDLKATLDSRLDVPMRRVRLQRLLETGQLPLFELRAQQSVNAGAGGAAGSSLRVTCSVENVGRGVALNARIGVYNNGEWHSIGSIGPGRTASATLSFARPLKHPGGGKGLMTAVEFSLPSGERLEMLFFTQLDKQGTPTSFIPNSMTLVQGTGFKLNESSATGQGG